MFIRNNSEMVQSDWRDLTVSRQALISVHFESAGGFDNQHLTSDRTRVPARKDARQLAMRQECLHVGTTTQAMRVKDACPHRKGFRGG